MVLCSNSINFYNPETNEIKTYWVSMKIASKNDDGEYVSRYITIGDASYGVSIRADDFTTNIPEGTRVLLPHGKKVRAFRINKIDPYTCKADNILLFGLVEDVLNRDRDNVELLIADYDVKSNGSTDEYKIFSNQMDSIRLGSQKIFTTNIQHRLE